MKKLMLMFVLVSFVGIGFAQPKNNATIHAKLLKTYTDPLNASDDTIKAVTVANVKVLDAQYVAILYVASDSTQAAVYVIGSNSALSVRTPLPYTDSISTILQLINGHAGFLTQPYFKGITLRGGGVDRLSGCDQFKIVTVWPAGADSAPYDRSKTVKVYLYWRE